MKRYISARKDETTCYIKSNLKKVTVNKAPKNGLAEKEAWTKNNVSSKVLKSLRKETAANLNHIFSKTGETKEK